jgi:hypothetical protein
MNKKQVPQKAKYTYVISEVEAKYAVKINKDKYTELKQKVTDNGGFCPVKDKLPENRCMCKQFLDRDSEGYCKFRLFYKEARTDKAAAAYLSAEPQINEKKEKELESELDKQEKQKLKLEDEE